MQLPTSVDPSVELGLIGFLLILIWKVLGVGQQLFLAKKGITPHEILNRARIKDIHNYTEGVQLQIARGEFECAWNGRDEVRDLLDTMKRLVLATEANTQELRRHNEMNGR